MIKPETFEDACVIVVEGLSELVISKQRDYGKDNILDFGEMGLVVRTNDKIARLKNLIFKKREGVTEPKIDAWRDCAGYAIVALLLDKGWFTLPLKGDK